MSGKWYIRTMQDKYFNIQAGGGLQAGDKNRSDKGLFDLVWQEDGSVCFKASNGKIPQFCIAYHTHILYLSGKYIGNKKSGHLFANCDSIEDNTRYFFYLINRPILVLKCDQGFVGYKAGSVKLECNKASYETIQVERVENGLVHFKGGDRMRTDKESEK